MPTPNTPSLLQTSATRFSEAKKSLPLPTCSCISPHCQICQSYLATLRDAIEQATAPVKEAA